MAKKTERISYEVDPHNRLICQKTEEGPEIPGFRAILDGKFEINKDNSVTYHLKKSQRSDIPQQLKLKGNWSLNKEHNLVLTLDKWGNQIAGNKLTLESEIIDAKDDALSFALTSKDSQGNNHIYIIRLNGRWQADAYNRLTFNAENERGLNGRLTLQGAWEVNKQNEVIYAYEKSLREKKQKITRTIAIKGYWQINEKHRIIYVLNKQNDSEFNFRVSAGKPAAQGLKYEIGIGATPGKKAITLFGSWKVNQKIGLLFEMPYEEGKINRVIFGASGKLDKNLNLEMRLENSLGKDLGIDVKLSKKILQGQGEAFIRALRSQKEVSIVAGVGFRT